MKRFIVGRGEDQANCFEVVIADMYVDVRVRLFNEFLDVEKKPTASKQSTRRGMKANTSSFMLLRVWEMRHSRSRL